MNETLRLGHIAGVRIGVNWSVLVIFVLIMLGLAAGRFPVIVPDMEPVAYVVAGFVAAVLFLLSLLAHEVSHAVVAQRHGIEVEGITLWMFGGVAQLRGEATDPRGDLAISGVGPLVSLVLGVAFGAAALVAAGADAPRLVTDVLTWLGVINVALAIFNLVPAAPLDGGRILRALLWRRHGDRQRAALTATRAGRVFGFVLIGLGLLQVVAVPGFGGLWLMLIGWFIVAAAGAEEQQTRMRSRLSDVAVRSVMSEQPTSAPASLRLDEFVERLLFRHPHSTFPLTGDDGRPLGLVTLRRVKQVPREDWARTELREIACGVEELAIAHPDELMVDVLDRMSSCADGRVLVVEDGRLVGMVSPSDVTRRLEIAELRRPAEAPHL